MLMSEAEEESVDLCQDAPCNVVATTGQWPHELPRPPGVCRALSGDLDSCPPSHPCPWQGPLGQISSLSTDLCPSALEQLGFLASLPSRLPLPGSCIYSLPASSQAPQDALWTWRRGVPPAPGPEPAITLKILHTLAQ